MGGLESGGYGPLVVGLARVDVIRSIRPGGPARHLAIEAIAKVRTANESFAVLSPQTVLKCVSRSMGRRVPDRFC